MKKRRREEKEEKGTRGGEGEGKLSALPIDRWASTGTASPVQLNLHVQVPVPFPVSGSVVG
jgi:hypothetical protein